MDEPYAEREVALRGRPASIDILRHPEMLGPREPGPPWASFGGWLLVLVAVFLIFAQWYIYPENELEQINGLWAEGFAIVIMMAALRIIFGAYGPHRIATGLVLLSGTGLVLVGALRDHSSDASPIVEITCGALVLIAGLMALGSPSEAPAG